MVGSFVDRARSGDPLTVEGDGDQTRDFVHVDDVVRANLAAATTDAVGRAYNVGTGESTRIDDLAATVRELADGDVEVRHAEGRPADIQHSCADISRAKEALGFSPTVTLEDGLADMLAVNAARQ